MKFSLALLTLIPTALGHYQLQYPASLGFDDDKEGQGPCGGIAIPSPLSSATATNVTVDSFAVSLKTGHPQSLWQFRATLSTQEPYNWTNLIPVVSQTSQGQFCLPNIKAPASFVGKTGIIQTVGSATDGYLYQCAVVNFVAGSNTTVGPTCTNATGLTASFTTQQNLLNSTGSGTTTNNATGTTTGASASTTSHSAANTVMQTGGLISAVFAVIGAVFMV